MYISCLQHCAGQKFEENGVPVLGIGSSDWIACLSVSLLASNELEIENDSESAYFHSRAEWNGIQIVSTSWSQPLGNAYKDIQYEWFK